MREIKFRAWNGEKMIYRCGICYSHGHWEVFGPHDYEAGRRLGVLNSKRFPNLVLMQYTGLKDKNGKEIYEGDIVIVRGEGIRPKIYTVEWLDTYGGFAFLDDEKAIPACEVPVLFCEVLGNIYENPELVKKFIEVKLHKDNEK